MRDTHHETKETSRGELRNGQKEQKSDPATASFNGDHTAAGYSSTAGSEQLRERTRCGEGTGRVCRHPQSRAVPSQLPSRTPTAFLLRPHSPQRSALTPPAAAAGAEEGKKPAGWGWEFWVGAGASLSLKAEVRAASPALRHPSGLSLVFPAAHACSTACTRALS